jgi:hypothetical protein
MAARITIELGAYAMLNTPDAWRLLTNRQRFPVAYLETAEVFRRLALNPRDLVWEQPDGQVVALAGATRAEQGKREKSGAKPYRRSLRSRSGR